MHSNNQYLPTHAFIDADVVGKTSPPRGKGRGKKDAVKSMAFHLVLPFIATFQGEDTRKYSVTAHPVLKMAAILWAHGKEKDVTEQEVSDAFHAFLPPMKSTTYRNALKCLADNLEGHARSLVAAETDEDGLPKQRIFAANFVECLTITIGTEDNDGMVEMERKLFADCLAPCKHAMPAGPSDDVMQMQWFEVFQCKKTLAYFKVLEPIIHVLLEELEKVVLDDVIAARRRDKHAPGSKIDPVGWSVLDVCMTFCQGVREGTIAGGNNKAFSKQFWSGFLEFGLETLGPLPDPDSLNNDEDVERYLRPYLFEADEDEQEAEGEEDNASQGSNDI